MCSIFERQTNVCCQDFTHKTRGNLYPIMERKGYLRMPLVTAHLLVRTALCVDVVAEFSLQDAL